MNTKEPRHALDHWLRIQANKSIEWAKLIDRENDHVQKKFESLCENERFKDDASAAIVVYDFMLEDVARNLLLAETFHRAICRHFGSLDEARRMAEAETETAVKAGLQEYAEGNLVEGPELPPFNPEVQG